jgi:hypothetical protein
LSSHHSLSFKYVRLLAFGSGIGFGAKISGSGSTLGEKAGEDWLDEGSEDDLGPTCLRESHPQDEDEFESVVESCEKLGAEHGACGW